MGEAGMILVFVLLAFFFGFSQKALSEPPEASSTVNSSKNLGPEQTLAKSEIERLLRELGSSTPPDPKTLSVGAMCYDTAMGTTAAFFICTKCGEKTHLESFKIFQIERAGSILAGISSLSAKLDTSGFCQRCSPEGDPKKNPELRLVIQYPDSKNAMVSPVTLEEIEILSQFLSGSDRYKDETGHEVAMKTYLPRLEKILGATE